MGHWFKSGTWTILDQALFAGSNFILHLLLARWLSAEAYGAFTIGFTLFILIGTLHTGLITEPMLVFGPGRYQSNFGRYLRLLVQGHSVFTSGCFLLLLPVGLLLYFGAYPQVGAVLVALALAQPFILLLWLMRRACYVPLKPNWAATGGLVYLVVLISGVYVLYHTDFVVLSAEVAMLALGIASLISALWLTRLLLCKPAATASIAFKKDVRLQHLSYGRWASATGVLEWIPGHIAFLVLPLAAGLEASGTLKALMNTVMPAANIYGALSVLLVSVLVRERSGPNFLKLLGRITGVVVLGTLVYWILLGGFGFEIIDWLYNGRHSEYDYLLWLVGALPVGSGIMAMLCAALRALERPNLIFSAHLAATAIALSVGVILIFEFGIVGALVSLLIQIVVEIVLLTYYLFRTVAISTSVALSTETAPTVADPLSMEI